MAQCRFIYRSPVLFIEQSSVSNDNYTVVISDA